MPYTVSEYNHSRPGFYADEGFPMIAAFGRFQDWDGVFSFAYTHTATIDPMRMESFFDIRNDTTKLAHMPACAAMFLRGDVLTARKTLLARLTPKMEGELLYKNLNAWRLATDAFGLDRLAPLVEEGGYLPCPDHNVPPNVPLENFRFYVERAREVWCHDTNLPPLYVESTAPSARHQRRASTVGQLLRP